MPLTSSAAGVADRRALGLCLTVLATGAVALLWPVLALDGQRLPGIDSRISFAFEHYTRSVLARGMLPHWNPFHFTGVAHLADTQTTVLYPVSLLLRWLPIVPYFGWMAALHVFVMGAGMLALARVVGLAWLPAFMSALAVMLGGAVAPTIYMGHLVVLYGTSWAPLALALAIITVRRASLWPHPALPLVLVVEFLAGYAQGALYVVGLVSLYFLFSVIWPDPAQPRRWRPAGQLVVLGTLTAALSAFQVLPTLTLFADAGRTAGLEYWFAAEDAWSFADLVTVFSPFSRTTLAEPLRELAGRSAYAGGLVAVLAFVAAADARRRRQIVFFAAITIMAMALAIGELPFYRWHHALFPGLRVPGRLLFIACIGLSLLGAIGLERLTVSLPRSRALQAAAVLYVAWDLSHFAAGAANPMSLQPRETALDLIPHAAGRVQSLCENRVSALELILDRQPTLDGLGGVFLGRYNDWSYLVSTGSQGPGDGTYHRISGFERYPERADLLGLTGVSVVLACTELARPDLRLLGARDGVFVYENLRARPRAFWSCGTETVSRLTAIDRIREWEYDHRGRLVRQSPDRRQTPSDESGATSLDHTTQGDDRQLLIGTGACDIEPTVQLSELDRPDGVVRASVDASAAGVVFFSEPYYPERRVWVDGREISPRLANLAFIGVPLDRGVHDIEIRYVPRRFQLGMVVSVLALLVWLRQYGGNPSSFSWTRRQQ